MDTLKIRRMHRKDIGAVIGIEEKCFPIPWTRGAFEQELEGNKLALYLVAVVRGQVVGYGGMWLIIDEAHITNIAIEPEFQGKGVGTKLTGALIHEACLKNIKGITLEVRQSNIIAQNLYKKMGFIPSGIRPEYYGDNGEDALIMWKEI